MLNTLQVSVSSLSLTRMTKLPNLWAQMCVFLGCFFVWSVSSYLFKSEIFWRFHLVRTVRFFFFFFFTRKWMQISPFVFGTWAVASILLVLRQNCPMWKFFLSVCDVFIVFYFFVDFRWQLISLQWVKRSEGGDHHLRLSFCRLPFQKNPSTRSASLIYL